MQLRRRDVEQWMSHRRLPGDLRRYSIFLFLTWITSILLKKYLSIV